MQKMHYLLFPLVELALVDLMGGRGKDFVKSVSVLA